LSRGQLILELVEEDAQLLTELLIREPALQTPLHELKRSRRVLEVALPRDQVCCSRSQMRRKGGESLLDSSSVAKALVRKPGEKIPPPPNGIVGSTLASCGRALKEAEGQVEGWGRRKSR
jgi:hypothetical protein